MSNVADYNKLLIVTGPQFSAIDYLNLVALIESTRLSRPLTHVIMTPQQAEKFAGLAPFPKSERVEIKQTLAPRKFILSFAKGDNKVKTVQWNQTEKDISMYISMENGNFRPDGMNFKIEGSDYDGILYFNVSSFADVAKIFEPYKNLVNEAKNISIGKQIGIEHQQVELIADPRHSTLAETVVAHIRSEISKPNAVRLMAAIMMESTRFKKPIKSSNIFATMAKLVDAGGDLNEANVLADKNAGGAPTGGQSSQQPQGQNNAPRPVGQPGQSAQPQTAPSNGGQPQTATQAPNNRV